ncbi:MAG: DUF1918 domain-containing protein [Actinobacteria bacterium]|nr:DUF1918 domain-containing protein [Actinomycetota bacterium]
MEVHAGDTIEIPSNKVGVPPRRGTVNEVLQQDPLKIEVTWEDGHQSIFEPAGGHLKVVS